MLIEFQSDISAIEVPQEFTFPFYYRPHQLSEIACSELQSKLEKYSWQHDFNFIGKMFGVLVVKDNKQNLFYLSAVSGKLQEPKAPRFLVPSLNQLNFENEKNIVDKLNKKITALQNDEDYLTLLQKLDETTKQSEKEIEDFRQVMREAKKIRKQKREQGLNHDELIKESLHYKHQLQILKEKWSENISQLQKKMTSHESELDSLILERKKILQSIQKAQFSQFKLLNAQGYEENLFSIFKDSNVPPGSGDCAGPKLLQYAYENNLVPVCMAEFWWGAPHKSEIRKHKHFYPACTSRCKPILNHMLKGLNIEKNPLLINQAKNKKIEILFEDDFLYIINKPHGLLSVPGKDINDSVATRLSKFLILHRLDQETSGIMVLAKDTKTHKNLQKQFIERSITKRYIALLDGIVSKQEGEIDLPLRGDPNNRPYQLVCHQYGKKSTTKYQVLKTNESLTLVHFWPQTGRTHQLRMHSSHQQGLNCPIIGDTMYGKSANRLHLHADRLEFTHPVSKDRILIDCPITFI
jgi:tRNA pseudouridine32 synthase/23S rRNA pseudouridine746 synthase